MFFSLAAKSYIKLLSIIQNKKATINIQNEGNKYFMYCLGRALDKIPENCKLERVSKHLIMVCVELGLDQIKMSVTLKDISKIEKDFNINIIVFGHEGGDIYPLDKVKEFSGKETVNLSFTSNGETNHYVWIKDFNKLCSKIIKYEKKKHICINLYTKFLE